MMPEYQYSDIIFDIKGKIGIIQVGASDSMGRA
jgi:hypothetical protein